MNGSIFHISCICKQRFANMFAKSTFYSDYVSPMFLECCAAPKWSKNEIMYV